MHFKIIQWEDLVSFDVQTSQKISLNHQTQKKKIQYILS